MIDPFGLQTPTAMNALLLSPHLIGTNILIASAIICLALWYYSRPHPGPGLWTCGVLLVTVGQYLAQGTAYTASLPYNVLCHSLLTAGETVLVIGVFRFLGRPTPWWLIPVTFLAAAPWWLWHWLLQPLETGDVVALYAFLSAFIRGMACYALLRLPGDRRLHSARIFAALMFGLLALSAAGSGVLGLFEGLSQSQGRQDVEPAAEMLAYNVGYPLWILCLFGLTLLSLRRFLLASQSSAVRFERLMNITSAAVVIVRDGRIVDANPVLKHLFGCPREFLYERPLVDLFETDEDLQKQLGRCDGVPMDRVAVRCDGNRFAAELTVAALDDGTQVAEIRDVSGRKSLEQELRRTAARDALTGVLNRRAFIEQAQLELAKTRQQGRPACLAMFDIDHFKHVNDTHGHLVGDQALKAFSAVCESHVRRTDLFARYGGEEFVLLLPQTDREQALALLERLRETWRQHRLPVPGGELASTVSIGMVQLDGDASLEHWVSLADQALYRAKHEGRNRTRVYAAE